MSYTVILSAEEQERLKRYQSIPNFAVRSLSFYNEKTREVIQDAITLDKFGVLHFKDRITETNLTKLIEKSKSIIEIPKDDGNYLYFQDQFTTKISLGDMYDLLFRNKILNGVRWFNQRSSATLDQPMDEYLVSEFYRINDATNLDPRFLDAGVTVEKTSQWKNIWFDVPCIEVITPDYVEGKYGSISATVNFRVKSDFPVLTGFRIYDATTDIELSRNIHFIVRTTPDYIYYTVPLSYQGPLPDTDKDSPGSCKYITLRDLQNITIVNKEEKGSKITKNKNNYYAVPITRHILKLQWITCDTAIEYDNIGTRIGNFDRSYSSMGESSLDVVIFDTLNVISDNYFQMNGTVDLNTVNNEDNMSEVILPHVIPEFRTKYSVLLSTNKNMDVQVVNTDYDRFTIKWNRYVKDAVVDWQIINKTEQITSELEQLTKPDRILNHNLFGRKDVNADFCLETGTSENAGSGGSIDVGECPCCLKPEDAMPLDIMFEVVNGLSDPPVCDDCNIDISDRPTYVYTVTDDFGNTRYTDCDGDPNFFLFKPHVVGSTECPWELSWKETDPYLKCEDKASVNVMDYLDAVCCKCCGGNDDCCDFNVSAKWESQLVAGVYASNPVVGCDSDNPKIYWIIDDFGNTHYAYDKEDFRLKAYLTGTAQPLCPFTFEGNTDGDLFKLTDNPRIVWKVSCPVEYQAGADPQCCESCPDPVVSMELQEDGNYRVYIADFDNISSSHPGCSYRFADIQNNDIVPPDTDIYVMVEMSTDKMSSLTCKDKPNVINLVENSLFQNVFP